MWLRPCGASLKLCWKSLKKHKNPCPSQWQWGGQYRYKDATYFLNHEGFKQKMTPASFLDGVNLYPLTYILLSVCATFMLWKYQFIFFPPKKTTWNPKILVGDLNKGYPLQGQVSEYSTGQASLSRKEKYIQFLSQNWIKTMTSQQEPRVATHHPAKHPTATTTCVPERLTMNLWTFLPEGHCQAR